MFLQPEQTLVFKVDVGWRYIVVCHCVFHRSPPIGIYCHYIRLEDSFQTLTQDATSRMRKLLSTSLLRFQTVTTNGNKRVSRSPCLWIFEMRDKIK